MPAVVSRCFKRRPRMRVLRVGPAQAGRNCCKAVAGAGACLRVVPCAFAHTKEVTGLTRLNDVAGRWSSSPPARFDGRELRSRERCQGTGSLRVRAAIYVEQTDNNVRETVFQQRNRYDCATAMREYSARWRLRTRACRPARCCILLANRTTVVVVTRRGVGRAAPRTAGCVPAQKVLGFREVAPAMQRPNHSTP